MGSPLDASVFSSMAAEKQKLLAPWGCCQGEMTGSPREHKAKALSLPAADLLGLLSIT